MKNYKYTYLFFGMLACLSTIKVFAQEALDFGDCGQSDAMYLVRAEVDVEAIRVPATRDCKGDILFKYKTYVERQIQGPISNVKFSKICTGGFQNWYGPDNVEVTGYYGARPLYAIGNSINNNQDLYRYINKSISAKILSITRVDGTEEPECIYNQPQPERFNEECSRNCLRYRTNQGDWTEVCVDVGIGDDYAGAIPFVINRINNEGDVVFDLFIDSRSGKPANKVAVDLTRLPEVERGYYDDTDSNQGESCGWKTTGPITVYANDDVGRIIKSGCVIKPMTLGETRPVIYCSQCSEGKKTIISSVFKLVQAGANSFVAYITGGSGLLSSSGATGIILSSQKDAIEGALCDPVTRQQNTSQDKTNTSIVFDEIPEELLAFPNPAKDRIYFNYQFTSEAELNINISDLMGKKVFDKTIKKSDTNIHKESIDISNLTPGVYVLNVAEENKNIKQTKFVVK